MLGLSSKIVSETGKNVVNLHLSLSLSLGQSARLCFIFKIFKSWSGFDIECF